MLIHVVSFFAKRMIAKFLSTSHFFKPTRDAAHRPTSANGTSLMKTLFRLATIIMLATIATSSASAGWGRDSVAFDGDESVYPIPPQEAHCMVTVLALTGTAKGMTMINEKTNTCDVISYTQRWHVKKLEV